MEVDQLVGCTTRSVRQERGLAIQALAHQANVSAAWLGERERGRQNVSVAVPDRLAKVLGFEAWELLQPQGGPETKKAP
jgi:transcriptional regulator with XRE-family HTH domain